MQPALQCCAAAAALIASVCAAAPASVCTPAASRSAKAQAPCPGATTPTKRLKSGRRVEAAPTQVAALGLGGPPYVALSEEEAHLALERDLLLKVGKQLQVSDYPHEARRWRWSGTVLVEVLVAGNGVVKQVALSRTSGFRVLDMQALAVVRRVPKLYVPVGLRQRDRTVTVPVGFYLQKL